MSEQQKNGNHQPVERMTEFIGVPVTPTMRRQVEQVAANEGRNVAQQTRWMIECYIADIRPVN